MASKPLGSWSDEEVLRWTEENIGNPDGRFPKMNLARYLDAKPILRHYRDGTQPALPSVGCSAPDGPLHDLDGTETTVHSAVREAQTPLVVLNFGSYT